MSYELNGGKNSSKNPTVYTMKTKTIKLAKPTRKGYKFKGLYSDSKFKNRVKTIESGSTGNVKLYAKWEKNKNK
uniref:InlB B-repeat-containing protein n=1 Tax=Roseburia sp. TaxID=2049040 RepID=UPI003FEFDF41